VVKRVLTGIYHRRVQYSEPAEKTSRALTTDEISSSEAKTVEIEVPDFSKTKGAAAKSETKQKKKTEEEKTSSTGSKTKVSSKEKAEPKKKKEEAASEEKNGRTTAGNGKSSREPEGQDSSAEPREEGEDALKRLGC